MAHDPIGRGPEHAPADAGSPTERLRRGTAAPPWQERGASADSPLVPPPRRRFPRPADRATLPHVSTRTPERHTQCRARTERPPAGMDPWQ
ncbi:hypothetical protein GCM10010301_13990 [Streptomyces plicatus]|nr:hypothetical protein GCM10010301_13990 [Streptomyces plicatus]